jgi:hypothetical protein
MRTTTDLAWAAGLFEGEGCITVGYRGKEYRYTLGQLTLSMKDEDVVRHFAEVIGFGKVYLGGKSNEGMWRWAVTRFEHVQAIVAMFWPWLGSRRRARAREVLERLKKETTGLKVNEIHKGHDHSGPRGSCLGPKVIDQHDRESVVTAHGHGD